MEIFKVDNAIINRTLLSAAYNRTFIEFKLQNDLGRTFNHFFHTIDDRIRELEIVNEPNATLNEQLKLILTTANILPMVTHPTISNPLYITWIQQLTLDIFCKKQVKPESVQNELNNLINRYQMIDKLE